MAASTNALDLAAAKLGVPINVGMQGGDLPTRYFSALTLSALTAAAWLGVSYSNLKIGALLAGMSGTIMLMAGLVFSQKTHFAGMILILVPFLLLASTAWQLRWLGILIGLLFVATITFNIASKRCGVNKIFGIVSVGENEVCETGV